MLQQAQRFTWDLENGTPSVTETFSVPAFSGECPNRKDGGKEVIDEYLSAGKSIDLEKCYKLWLQSQRWLPAVGKTSAGLAAVSGLLELDFD